MKQETNNRAVRTWLEINTSAIANNYKAFRGIIKPECKLMAVVKSNAYGHGLINFSKELEKLGADFLGVDSIVEAIALRREGVKAPILVLGYTLPEMINAAMLDNISITVSSLDQLKGVKKYAEGVKPPVDSLKIHLKVDTGMHRQGFYPNELSEAIKSIKTIKHVEIEGIYTHFAAAKNPAFPADTNNQIEEFKKACEILEQNNIKAIKHAAATSGAIVFPDSHFDMVRIGIGLYGLWPSKEVKSCYEKKINLKPVLAWRTRISEIKEVRKGERVGYDFTETFGSDSKIAILPIGYWHGFRRNLSSIGQVLIDGKRAKILGRVSMDMICIDITTVKNAKVGDIVTIIGQDGNEEITAEEMAYLSDTSWYETITTINPLIKRIYVKTDNR